MVILPPFAVLDFGVHSQLITLANSQHLFATSLAQRNLVPFQISTLIQVLSLLPDPKTEPYFRRFIQLPQYADLPTIVADGFVKAFNGNAQAGLVRSAASLSISSSGETLPRATTAKHPLMRMFVQSLSRSLVP